MPRRKPTEEEIDEWHRQGCARLSWLSTHPEEMMKEQTAEVERYKKRAAKNLKKHQPVVTDMNFNGEFVTVEFTRHNGERVIGTYKLTGWDWAPLTVWNRLAGQPRKCAAGPEPGLPPPGPAEAYPI
jgi:hypothetical protein